MFINNKYTNCYTSLIANALNRGLDSSTYTEKHHIIPKCMGGPDTADNLVRLTAKEHYIAHLLLTKMTEGVYKRKMCFALWRMTQDPYKRNSRYQVTATQYENIKKKMSQHIQEQNKGQQLTSEQKAKQKAGILRRAGPWNKGKQMSEEFRNNISRHRKGATLSCETRAKISAGIKNWNKERKGTPRSLKDRKIPRYTSIIEHKITKEQYTTSHLREWLAERGLKPHHLHYDRCDYIVIRRFVTRTGEEISVTRK